MLRPKVSFKVIRDEVERVERAFKSLSKKNLLVGIPESRADRAPFFQKELLAAKPNSKRYLRAAAGLLANEINNAQLLYIHTNGSPLRGIPARVVIEAAIADPENKEMILAQFRAAQEFVLDGNESEAIRSLNKAGQVAVSLCKQWFTNPNNGWAPNAPATIRRKGSARPLIDTGALRRALTYILQDKAAA